MDALCLVGWSTIQEISKIALLIIITAKRFYFQKHRGNLSTPARPYITQEKRPDNALSLFRVAHAMRDHSVYDTYGA